MEKVKVELEYIIKTSPNVLFTCLSTPSGLSEWFANDVNIKDQTYTFFWDRSEESALLMKSKRDSVRFQWEDDEGEDYYFEMAIKIDDLTKHVALIVTEKNTNEQEIKKFIENINTKLSLIEKIKKFLVIYDEFTIENRMLTPTLKLKRKIILENYKKDLENLY